MDATTSMDSESEVLQREHYNEIATQYFEHYNDTTSQQYVATYYCTPGLKNLSISGKKILDAMCGPGQATGYLLRQHAHVVGLDMSQSVLRCYKERYPQVEARCASIVNTGLPQESFDAIVILQGLHHVHPNVPNALREISRILKPNGYLVLVEPLSNTWPDRIRKLWYKMDPFFEENELALDFEELVAELGPAFQLEFVHHCGGPAYFLIYNSMICRVPLRFKPLLAKLLFPVEHLFMRLMPRFLSSYSVMRFKKK